MNDYDEQISPDERYAEAFAIGRNLVPFTLVACDGSEHTNDQAADAACSELEDIHRDFAGMDEHELRGVLDGFLFFVRTYHRVRTSTSGLTLTSTAGTDGPTSTTADYAEHDRGSQIDAISPTAVLSAPAGHPVIAAPQDLPYTPYREGRRNAHRHLSALNHAHAGNLETARRQATDADRLLSPLGGVTEPDDLRDLLAGLAKEIDSRIVELGVTLPY